MSDPFVHLHVASGYSLRYGASHPQTLVERAAEQEMDTLALTDRDGTYGAVKFARACYAAGHPPGARGRARPPAATQSSGTDRRSDAATPVRGGAYRDPVVRRAAAGDVPGHAPTVPGGGPGRLGGAVPAGLGDPPVRRARPPGPRPRRRCADRASASSWRPAT